MIRGCSISLCCGKSETIHTYLMANLYWLLSLLLVVLCAHGVLSAGMMIYGNGTNEGNNTQNETSGCGSYQTCSQCTSELLCIWCPSMKKCFPGFFWGPEIVQCDDYTWLGCSAPGKVIFTIMLVVSLVIILGIGVGCIYFYCCRKKTKELSARAWQYFEHDGKLRRNRLLGDPDEEESGCSIFSCCRRRDDIN